MTKTWSGYELKPCDRCGTDDWSLENGDYQHDGGACQVFRCGGCNRSLHVELPD